MTRRAIVMAGGKGRRLLPYTSVLPKPLMPLGDRPILEIVVGQLRSAGFGHITMAVGHLASLIQVYFGDGEKFGVTIDYSMEHEPLGTAGPLGLLRDALDEDFLFMNGDVLTDLDFGALLDEHTASGAATTLAVFNKRIDVALGVLTVDEQQRITDYDEKPQLDFTIAAGIGCMHPRALAHLQAGERIDLPALIERLLAAGETVRAAPITGSWLDIGRPEDYEVALRAYEAGEFGDPDAR